MRTFKIVVAGCVVAGLAFSSLGCSFLKRGTERYRNDTTALLEKNSSSLKECYDAVLKTESSAAGTVVVTFKLENETGKIFDVAIDEGKSTAPKGVQECVSRTVLGLTLEPPDAVDGHATYTYEFQANPQKAPEPAKSDFKTDAAPAGAS